MDWSTDVCSSDLTLRGTGAILRGPNPRAAAQSEMAVLCNRLLRPTATAVPAAACRPSMIETGYHALYRGSLFQSKSEDAMFAKTYHATHPDMMDCVDNDDLDRKSVG